MAGPRDREASPRPRSTDAVGITAMNVVGCVSSFRRAKLPSTSSLLRRCRPIENARAAPSSSMQHARAWIRFVDGTNGTAVRHGRAVTLQGDNDQVNGFPVESGPHVLHWTFEKLPGYSGHAGIGSACSDTHGRRRRGLSLACPCADRAMHADDETELAGHSPRL